MRERIRNFAIIAHIDHGKSTTADKIMELCGCRISCPQALDSLSVERERGITVKAQAVHLQYVAKDGETYFLNLMDTPGHVDFSYEVDRCLKSCEGAILIVDASQGVEAQTISNVNKALDHGLVIISVANKIDLLGADVEDVRQQIEAIGVDASDLISMSAKTGAGVVELLEAIVHKIPAPKNEDQSTLKALIFDGHYDSYHGVVALIRVFSGTIKAGDKVLFKQTNKEYSVLEVGRFTPSRSACDSLSVGEIGYFLPGMKELSDCNVGDTVVAASDKKTEALPGFRKVRPVVYCNLFSADSEDVETFKVAIKKLHMNDSSFEYRPETCSAMGFGFRCGFLGALHREVIQQRLKDEYEVPIIATLPSVNYKIFLSDDSEIEMRGISEMPDPSKISHIQEPIALVNMVTLADYVGDIIEVCQDRRSMSLETSYTKYPRVSITCLMPLAEMVYGFHDKIKSAARGHASFDWDFFGYETADIVKVSILINAKEVGPLSFFSHRSKAETRGREVCKRLRDLVPKHLFIIPIQAAIGGRIIARETVKALRKDVTAKCYGGDISRKRKLLDKQKKGKKRMRVFGNIELGEEVFIEALRVSSI